MRGGRAVVAGALAVVLLSPTPAATQEVREYVGTFSPRADFGAYVNNRARFVVSTAGLGADLTVRVEVPEDAPDPPPQNPDDAGLDLDFFEDGGCYEISVDTLRQPAPFDPAVSGAQTVVAEVPITLGLAFVTCARAPATLEARQTVGDLDLVVDDNVVFGTLLVEGTLALEFRSGRSGGGGSTTTPTTPGGGTAPDQNFEGAQIRERDLEEISGCDFEDPDAPGRCVTALLAADTFAADLAPHVNNTEILADLRNVVLGASLRSQDGRPVAPSLSVTFPVILQLAAQADAGDAEALLALRRLIGGLLAQDTVALR